MRYPTTKYADCLALDLQLLPQVDAPEQLNQHMLHSAAAPYYPGATPDDASQPSQGETPPHNVQDASMQGQIQGAVPPRRPNLAEMQEKAQSLRNGIQKAEERLKALQAQQGGPLGSELLAAEISQAQKEVEIRRAMLAKTMLLARGVTNGQANVNTPRTS